METQSQFSRITKALIIADPWIGFILDGSKTWEMRASATSHRGWFGLIRKGTGAVYGVARLADVGRPLSPAEMIAAFEYHCIPEHMIRSGEVAKWNTPWKLTDVRRLNHPVPYSHKSGAVTWVELDTAAVAGIASELHGEALMDSDADQQKRRGEAPAATKIAVCPSETPPRHAPLTERAQLSSSPASAKAGWIGEVEINEANLQHNHFYLRSLIHKFPADLIGGSNKATAASREAIIDWGGPEPERTDIDGAKKFFRARGWIGSFYKLNHAQAGDLVVIEETAPYHYRVSVRKPGSLRRTS